MTSTHIEGMIMLTVEDVVVVHKLLKNSIEDAEYIMLSEKLLSHYDDDEIINLLSWDQLKEGKDEYEYIGEIKYKYIPLSSSKRDNETSSLAAEGKMNGRPVTLPKITPLTSRSRSVQQ